MKGHLDVKELEKYKKADIEKLAKDLGVSTEGTIKEIAVRCAEAEVEIPDSNKLEPDEDEEAAGKAKAGNVVAIQTYHDLQLKRIVEAGETLKVSKDRADELINLKLVKKAE